MSSRFELRPVVTVCVLVIGCLCVPLSGAVAQSIFSDLFSFTLQAPKPRSNSFAGPYDPFEPRPRNFSGGYRTICVRTCDGYYFPISHSTRRSNFYEDAKRCQARCPGQARLFYTPSREIDIKWATDVSGLTYKDLQTAFLYRKKLVKGCSCRPAPWAPEERARHKMYETEGAEIATLSKGNAGIDTLSSDIAERPGGGVLPNSAGGRDELVVTGIGDAEKWKARGNYRRAGKSLLELNKNPYPRRYNHLRNSARTDAPQFLWAGDGH